MSGPLPPRQSLLLNGIWDLQPSDDPLPPARWNHRIQVPALVDAAEPGYEWRPHRFHWYRTTFQTPVRSPLAFLIVEQSMFGTEVWLNGRHLGGDIGCYTSQEYDVREALRIDGVQELIVRVGRKADLPDHSAVGADQERADWIPGIWGDVVLVQSGNPRISNVLVIPHIREARAEARITLENRSAEPVSCTLSTSLREKRSGRTSGGGPPVGLTLPASGTSTAVVDVQIDDMHLWSPESPFLYELVASPAAGVAPTDTATTTFGMREFRIEGREFLLNGRPIRLRGGNIAFHRFLTDADRRLLPWDPAWIRRVLIDIPKAHNFNFFRNHLGQMYNRWYDIADEHGMLLQNEWMFWTTTGTREQIVREFTRWLQDNGNHPSIVIWDPLNESSDATVQTEIVPVMKKLDPTRPWESVDVVEEHPYIYSLGPVLNNRKFGFTRALDEIGRSTAPTMLNEFCWWWLDREFAPSVLTREVVERWLGPVWTQEELVAHQSFLITELVELFRRLRVNAIQPFVYLSNNAGPTANWFSGDIRDLAPKPVMAALRNAFAPFGISIELWDRHFEAREHRVVNLFVFNDHDGRMGGTVSCTILDGRGERMFETTREVLVDPSGCTVVPVILPFPSRPGRYVLRGEIRQGRRLHAFSEKEAHVFPPLVPPAVLRGRRVAVLSTGGELPAFLAESGMEVNPFEGGDLSRCTAAVIGEGLLRSSAFMARSGAVERMVNTGGMLLVIEPEFGLEEKEQCPVLPGIRLEMERRDDRDKGGYDSYVFPSDPAHYAWQGIEPAHLRMFNGGYGGEVVSEHLVTPDVPHVTLARCGLHLMVPAAYEIPRVDGTVVVSRLQLRGRLRRGTGPDSLYARRPDPVLQRFLLNVLSRGVGLPPRKESGK